MQVGVLLACLLTTLSLAECRLDAEQLQELAEQLQEQLEQLPGLLDLYKADIMHKVARNTVELEHMSDIQHILNTIQLEDVLIKRDLYDELKASISSWRTEVWDLELHDDIKDKMAQYLNHIYDDLEADSVELIKVQLDRFVTKYERKWDEERRRRVPEEVVTLLLSDEVDEAAALSLEVTSDNKLRSVVRRVYHHGPYTFPLIVDYAEKIRSHSKAIQVYTALYQEMIGNHHLDIDRHLTVLENIERWYNDVDVGSQPQVNSLIDFLKITITEQGVQQLKTLIERDEKPTEETRELCRRIIVVDRLLYQDILRQVIREVFDKVPTSRLLDFVGQGHYIEQEIDGLAIVQTQMKTSKDTTQMLRLWYILKTIILNNEADLNNEQKGIVMKIKAEIGTSIQTAISEKNICIKNDKRKMHLAGSKLGQQHKEWTVMWNGNGVLLKRVGSKQTLCATGQTALLSHSSRPVQEGGRNCEEEWWVEPLPDGACLIRSIKFNEYLFAGESGEVGTWLGGTKPSGSAWRLEVCQEVNIHEQFKNYTVIYDAIMSEPGEKNVPALIYLISNITRMNLYATDDSDYISSSRVNGFISSVEKRIVTETTKIIKMSLETEEGVNLKDVFLSNMIYKFKAELYNETISKLVEETLGTVSPNKIIKFLYHQEYNSQVFYGLDIVLHKLISFDKMTAAMSMARQFYKWTKLQNLSEHKRTQVLTLRALFGQSIDNAIYYEKVCIRNIERDRYVNGNILGDKAEWNVVFVDNDNAVMLIKEGTEKTLCVTGDRNQVSNNTRPVLEGGGNCEEEWWVEPLPDGACLIRSIKFNEYLFVGESGEVGTWLGGTKHTGSAWRLELCQKIDINEHLRINRVIYKEIMNKPGEKNITGLIDILSNIRKMHLHATEHSDYVFSSQVDGFISSVEESIVTETTKIIKMSLETEEHVNLKDVYLCNMIYIFKIDLYNETISKLVKETLGIVSPNKIIRFLCRQKYTLQIYYGLDIVLHKLISFDKMTAAMSMARQFYKWTSRQKLLKQERTRVFTIRALFGQSIDNAIFYEKVCIRNIERDRYVNGNILGDKAEWNVVFVDNDNAVMLIKEGTEKTLCVTGDRNQVSNNTRPVLEGGRNCEEEWWVEPLPDGACLIRSIKFNEYLFAGESGEVGTWLGGTKPPGSAWRLELCQEMDINEQLRNYTEIYDAIMSEPGEKNITGMIDLISNIRKMNWYATDESDYVFSSKMDGFISRVGRDIVVEITKIIKMSLETEEGLNPKDVFLCSMIYEFKTELYNETISKLAGETLGTVSPKKVIQFVRHQKYHSQVFYGLDIVLHKLISFDKMTAAMSMARELYKWTKLQNLSEHERTQVLTLRALFGQSIDNAIYYEKVCIRNIERDRYVNGNILGDKAEWKVVFVDNDNAVMLIKEGTEKTLCVTGDRNLVSNNTRPVLEGGGNCEEEWWVEPLPDGACLIRSIKFNEYLFAGESGEVGTWLGGTKPPGSAWRLELCQDPNEQLRNYRATYEAIMSEPGEKNITGMIDLLSKIQKTNLHDTDSSYYHASSRKEVSVSSVEKSIVNEAKKIIMKSLQTEEDVNLKDVFLSNMIYEFKTELYNETISKLAEETLGTVSPKKVIQFVRHQKYRSQVFYGLDIVLHKLIFFDKTTAAMSMAREFYKWTSRQKLLKQERTRVFTIRALFGQSIDNAIFYEKVCIRNIERDRYVNGNILGDKAEWNVVFVDNDNAVMLIKEGTEKTLCVTGDRNLVSNNTRPVLEGGRNCEEEWWVEPLPDGACLIRSIKFNEYLFAGESGEVGTWLGGTKHTGSAWRLELCQKNDINEQLRNYTVIYDAIMGEPGEKNITGMIDLISNIRKMNWYATDESDYVFSSKVDRFISRVERDIVVEITNIIKGTLETEEDVNSNDVFLCSMIYEFKTELYNETISRLVEETLGTVSPKKVIQFVLNQEYDFQVTYGLDIMMHKLQSLGNMTAVMSIARAYFNYINDPFILLSEYEKKEVIILRALFGESIDNAVFHQKVCIRNNEGDGYVNGNILGDKAEWNVVFVDNDNAVMLIKEGTEKTLCVTGDRNLVSNNTRPVLEGGGNCEEEWWVEPLPDGACLIRSIKFNEYLFAGESGEVGTWLGGTKPLGSAWLLEPC